MSKDTHHLEIQLSFTDLFDLLGKQGAVDEDGKSKQTSMPYFESGWVDPKDLEKEEKRKQEGGGGSFKFPWQK